MLHEGQTSIFRSLWNASTFGRIAQTDGDDPDIPFRGLSGGFRRK